MDYADQSLDPCDNFYKFACNKIERYNTPDGGYPIARLGEIYERVQRQLKESIESELEEKDPETLKKLQRHYNLCLNTGINFLFSITQSSNY